MLISLGLPSRCLCVRPPHFASITCQSSMFEIIFLIQIQISKPLLSKLFQSLTNKQNLRDSFTAFKKPPQNVCSWNPHFCQLESWKCLSWILPAKIHQWKLTNVTHHSSYSIKSLYQLTVTHEQHTTFNRTAGFRCQIFTPKHILHNSSKCTSGNETGFYIMLSPQESTNKSQGNARKHGPRKALSS